MDFGALVDVLLVVAVALVGVQKRQQVKKSDAKVEDALAKLTSYQGSTSQLYARYGKKLDEHIKSRMHR